MPVAATLWCATYTTLLCLRLTSYKQRLMRTTFKNRIFVFGKQQIQVESATLTVCLLVKFENLLMSQLKLTHSTTSVDCGRWKRRRRRRRYDAIAVDVDVYVSAHESIWLFVDANLWSGVHTLVNTECMLLSTRRRIFWVTRIVRTTRIYVCLCV